MAQRTGPERFLGSLLKAAGAGLIPVLVAAVLLGLAGCGGGSDAQTTANAEGKTTAQSPSVSNKGKQGHSTSEAEQAGAASRVEAAGAARGSGKHGPAVAAPKGEEEPEITPQQREEATVANISFSSPSLPKTKSVAVLPADYTCDGANKWPAFSWSGIPAGTKEVALLMMNTQPVDEKLFFDWAIAGIDPKLRRHRSRRASHRSGGRQEQLRKERLLDLSSEGQSRNLHVAALCPAQAVELEAGLRPSCAARRSRSPSRERRPDGRLLRALGHTTFHQRANKQ